MLKHQISVNSRNKGYGLYAYKEMNESLRKGDIFIIFFDSIGL